MKHIIYILFEYLMCWFIYELLLFHYISISILNV